jgi:N-carbamoylputrescine amidase
VGTEEAPEVGGKPVTFYGGSFISGPNGELLAGPASNTEDEIISAQLNLDEIDRIRKIQPIQRDLHGQVLKTQLQEKQAQEPF